jgi:translation initiation factor 2A
MPTNGTSPSPRGPYSRSPGPGANGYGQGQQNGAGRRHVPGAPPPHTGSPTPEDREKKGKKKKEKKKQDKEQISNVNGSAGVPAATPVPKLAAIEINAGPSEALANSNGGGSVPPTPGGDLGLDPTAKKIRNLNKKLKAIDELKEKVKKGERLEVTQLKKISGEADLRKELASLTVA